MRGTCPRMAALGASIGWQKPPRRRDKTDSGAISGCRTCYISRDSDKPSPMDQTRKHWMKICSLLIVQSAISRISAAEEPQHRTDLIRSLKTKGPYGSIQEYCQRSLAAYQPCTGSEPDGSGCWPQSIVCELVTGGPYAPMKWPKPPEPFVGFGVVRQEFKPSNGEGEYHLALQTRKGWYVAELGLSYNLDRGRGDSAILSVAPLPMQDGMPRLIVRSVTAGWYTDKNRIDRFDCAGQVTVCRLDTRGRPFCNEAITVAFQKKCIDGNELAHRRWNDWQKWPWQLEMSFPTPQSILLREGSTAHEGPPARDLYGQGFSNLLKVAKARIGRTLALAQR